MAQKIQKQLKNEWFFSALSEGLSQTFFYLVNSFPVSRKILYSALFNLIAIATMKLSDVKLMNYGFADIDGSFDPIKLEPLDEPERYSLQLYHYAISGVNTKGLDVLDISCGRGGGASYIYHYLRARHVWGLDFCKRNINFCKKNIPGPGLTFVHGSAEAMPFSNARFDVAVNVEASFCYTNMKIFVAEVSRVLRPGGFFAFADLRHKYEVQELRTFFAESAFEVVEEKNISENVIKALELDGSRRMNEVKRLIPKTLQNIFMTYAGAEGSRIPTLLGNGEIVYFRFLLKKPYK